MSSLGVRLSDFGVHSHPMDLFNKAKHFNYDSGQLVLFKSFDTVESYASTVDSELVNQIKSAMYRLGFDLPVLGCYQDLLYDDTNTLVRNFIHYCAIAKELEPTCVGTETSCIWRNNSYSLQEIQKVYNHVIDFISIAHDYGVSFGLEICAGHPLSSIKDLEKILKHIKSDRDVTLIFDPANLIFNADLEKQHVIFSSWVKEFSSLIRVVHLKNFTLDNKGARCKSALQDGLIAFDFVFDTLINAKVKAHLIREEPFLNNSIIHEQDLDYMKAYVGLIS